MEWKTIDSAPKDGTEVLLWQPVCISIGYFHDATGAWWIECGQITGDPTYWLPLPTPPVADSILPTPAKD